MVKRWSRTQATRALSTVDAKYNTVITGTAEGLSVQLIKEDFGVRSRVRVWTGSNAAKAIASRRVALENRARRAEALVASGCNQVGESVNEKKIPGGQKSRGPCDERANVERCERQLNVSSITSHHCREARNSGRTGRGRSRRLCLE